MADPTKKNDYRVAVQERGAASGADQWHAAELRCSENSGMPGSSFISNELNHGLYIICNLKF
jgi:hypothetical protein